MTRRTRNLILTTLGLSLLASILVLHCFLLYLIVYPGRKACPAMTLPGMEIGSFAVGDNVRLAYQTLTPGYRTRHHPPHPRQKQL